MSCTYGIVQTFRDFFSIRTFRAVHTKDAIFQKLEYIASLLERDLETEGWAGKIVILTYKLDTFRGACYKSLDPLDTRVRCALFSPHPESDIRPLDIEEGRPSKGTRVYSSKDQSHLLIISSFGYSRLARNSSNLIFRSGSDSSGSE